jgi:hypothetical protein
VADVIFAVVVTLLVKYMFQTFTLIMTNIYETPFILTTLKAHVIKDICRRNLPESLEMQVGRL